MSDPWSKATLTALLADAMYDLGAVMSLHEGLDLLEMVVQKDRHDALYDRLTTLREDQLIHVNRVLKELGDRALDACRRLRH